MESLPDRLRHGPADLEMPPPGGPWQPLVARGRLVGWDRLGSRAMANRAVELGEMLALDQRSRLLGRLGHKLRSATLALAESARQAAFGRPELLEAVYEQAQEVGRRAAAFEAAAIDPKDRARSVVLGAVLNLTAQDLAADVPRDAVVVGSEPVLVDAFTRAREWMGSRLDNDEGTPRVSVAANRVGEWWRVSIESTGARRALPVPEMGEPLLRLIVDIHLDGWLDTTQPKLISIYLPASMPR
jgi:hypothetical protein